MHVTDELDMEELSTEAITEQVHPGRNARAASPKGCVDENSVCWDVVGLS